MTDRQKTWGWVACGWLMTFCGSEVCLATPFLNLYLQDRGLSQQQIGIMGAMRPWVGVPASFMWAAGADYFKAHRALLISLIVSASAIRCLLPFVEGFQSFLVVVFFFTIANSPVLIMGDSAIFSRCDGGCYGVYRKWGSIGWGTFSPIAGALSQVYGIQAAYVLSMTLMCVCAVLSWFLTSTKAAPAMQDVEYITVATSEDALSADGAAAAHQANADCSDADSVSSEQAQQQQQEQRAGMERQSGEAMDAVVHAPVLLPCMKQRPHACARKAPSHPSLKDAEAALLRDGRDGTTGAGGGASSSKAGAPLSLRQQGFGAKLLSIFSRRESLAFFWTATVMGVALGMIEGFNFIYLAKLGASRSLLGLTLSVTTIADVPVLHFLGKAMLYFGGPDVLLDICLGAYVLRMLLYAALPMFGSLWWIMPIELLHGLTFACGFGAACEKNKLLAPPGLETTQQGVFSALYAGLGMGTGALLGGMVAERYGFQTMFICGAYATATGWIVSQVASFIFAWHARMFAASDFDA